MNPFVIIVVALLILAFLPFFVLLGATVKDLRETRRKIKQNEEDIRKIIGY